MNRVNLSLAIVFLLIWTTGCQFYQRFILVNESDGEIVVEYAIKGSGLWPEETLLLPRVMSTAEMNSWFGEKEWKPMPYHRFDFDDAKRLFRLQVGPGEAVLIEEEDPYHIEKDGEKAIDIDSLQITDSGKVLHFENSKRLLEEFVRNDFLLTYR